MIQTFRGLQRGAVGGCVLVDFHGVIDGPDPVGRDRVDAGKRSGQGACGMGAAVRVASGVDGIDDGSPGIGLRHIKDAVGRAENFYGVGYLAIFVDVYKRQLAYNVKPEIVLISSAKDAFRNEAEALYTAMTEWGISACLKTDEEKGLDFLAEKVRAM